MKAVEFKARMKNKSIRIPDNAYMYPGLRLPGAIASRTVGTKYVQSLNLELFIFFTHLSSPSSPLHLFPFTD